MQSSASGSSSKAMRGLRLASPSALLVAALAPALLVAQQPTTITGQVTAEDGLAIEFVAVAIESMNLGTLTDREGRYELIIRPRGPPARKSRSSQAWSGGLRRA